jgi:hypothetical protein
MKIRVTKRIILEEMMREFEEKIIMLAPEYLGDLKRSISGRINDDNEIIISMNGYAEYINDGTIPPYIDIEKLKGWCAKKLGDENLAWPVMKKIKRDGINPNPFIDNAIYMVLNDRSLYEKILYKIAMNQKGAAV